MSITQLWLVYLASTFIIFLERDITSENHGTPVHISTFTFSSYFQLHFFLLRWSFVNDKAGGIDNSSVLVGSNVTCCVCAGPRQPRHQFGKNFCALDTVLYLFESSWYVNLGMFTEGNLLLRYISPSTWGNQRKVRELSSSPYQANFGRRCRGLKSTS